MTARAAELLTRQLTAVRRGSEAMNQRGALDLFLASRQLPDGWFIGRDDKADLYYTVFGWQILAALGRKEELHTYRKAFLHKAQPLDQWDFVHLCGAIRCGFLSGGWDDSQRTELLTLLGRYRSGDGGFADRPAAITSTAYATFLTVHALDELGERISTAERMQMIAFLHKLQCDDGGFALDGQFALSLTPATAAVVVLLKWLGEAIPDTTINWLMTQRTGDGGWRAAALAPSGDLLSTATVLHALAAAGVRLSPSERETTREFVLSHRRDGGFAGSVDDATADVEYTFYGLVALGELEAMADGR